MIILRTGITAETYVLSQKEFGMVSNAVNKLRRNLAKQLSKSIEKDINLWGDSLDKSIGGGIVKIKGSKQTRNNVYQEASKNNTRISRLNLRGRPEEIQSPMYMTNKKAECFANADDIISGYKNSPKRIKRLRKSIESSKVSGQIIIPPKNKNIDLVAHEIGHASNATSANPIVKSTHKRANKISGESDSKFGMLTSKMGTHRRSGLKNIIRDFIDEESLIAEESRASRKGLRILRKSGATKQELDQAKANYKIGLDSYKGKGRANWKSTLRNTIQTEDKRGGSFRDD